MNPVSNRVSEWEPEWEIEEIRDGVVVRRLKPIPEELRKAEREKERRARWHAELESLNGMKIVMFYPKKEYGITKFEAIRAIQAAVVQILKDRLDRRLEEEFLAPYVCDAVIQHSDDYMEIGTKCIGYAFDLHVHIEYTVSSTTEGCVVIGTVVPTRVEGVGE
jgi:hypothetical protein